MIWLLLILGIGLFVMGVILYRNDEFSIGGMFSCISGTMLVIGLLIGLPIQTFKNGATVAEMQTFLESNTKNYQYSIDETASYLSSDTFKDNVLVEGSIEKLQQAGYVSERIKEWRDSVNDYNTKLASMKYYNSNIFLGVLYPNAVDDMKMLIIK
jgi:hypothetical protein